MDNAILLVSVLIFGWLVIGSYYYRKGFQSGIEYEKDATARRFHHFRIEKFSFRNTRRYRPNGASRHAPVSEERFNGF